MKGRGTWEEGSVSVGWQPGLYTAWGGWGASEHTAGRHTGHVERGQQDQGLERQSHTRPKAPNARLYHVAIGCSQRSWSWLG